VLICIISAESAYLLYDFVKSKSVSKNVATVDCNVSDCWDEEITQLLDRGGVSLVFERLPQKYSTPDFSGQCHGYVHLIGEKAYLLFSDGIDLRLSENTSHCGYGFYHGFIEALIINSGKDYHVARNFCDYVKTTMSEKSRASLQACFHGFGHGIVDGYYIPENGDARVLIEDGLTICEEVGRTDFEIDLCNSGVFNSLSIIEGNPDNSIVWEDNDPYWICNTYEQHTIKKPCYEEMNTLTMRYAQGNFAKALSFAMKIDDIKYRQLAVQSLSGFYASFKPNTEDVISKCLSLTADVKNYCITGFIGGMLEFGTPKNEYIEAFSFCDSTKLSDIDKLTCYKRIAGGALDIYSPETHRTVCQKITERFQDVCS
jgi:hypothetical protein